MRTSYVIIFLFLISLCHAQEDKVFVVKAKRDIYLMPNSDTLIAGNKYIFQVKNISLSDIRKISFSYGQALIMDSVIVLTVHNDNEIVNDRVNTATGSDTVASNGFVAFASQNTITSDSVAVGGSTQSVLVISAQRNGSVQPVFEKHFTIISITDVKPQKKGFPIRFGGRRWDIRTARAKERLAKKQAQATAANK